MFGACPLRFRPIITVNEKEANDKKSSISGSKKAKSISSKKPPLISNNNDIENLKEPSVNDQN